MYTFAGKVYQATCCCIVVPRVDCSSNFIPESSSELCNRRTNSFSPKKIGADVVSYIDEPLFRCTWPLFGESRKDKCRTQYSRMVISVRLPQET